MTCLLGCIFVGAKIKEQKGMWHALNIGGSRAMCQDRMLGRRLLATGCGPVGLTEFVKNGCPTDGQRS
jgi:hypothetical protein